MKYLNEDKNFQEKTLPTIKNALQAIIENAENQNLLIVLSVSDNRCATDMLMGNQMDIDHFFIKLAEENNEIFRCMDKAMKNAKKFKKFVKKQKGGGMSGRLRDKLRDALGGMDGMNGMDDMGEMGDKLRDALDGLKAIHKEMDGNGSRGNINGSRGNISEAFGKLIDRDPNFFMIAQHRIIELFEQKGIPTPASIKEATTGKELMDAFKGAEDLINKF